MFSSSSRLSHIASTRPSELRLLHLLESVKSDLNDENILLRGQNDIVYNDIDLSLQALQQYGRPNFRSHRNRNIQRRHYSYLDEIKESQAPLQSTFRTARKRRLEQWEKRRERVLRRVLSKRDELRSGSGRSQNSSLVQQYLDNVQLQIQTEQRALRRKLYALTNDVQLSVAQLATNSVGATSSFENYNNSLSNEVFELLQKPTYNDVETLNCTSDVDIQSGYKSREHFINVESEPTTTDSCVENLLGKVENMKKTLDGEMLLQGSISSPFATAMSLRKRKFGTDRAAAPPPPPYPSLSSLRIGNNVHGNVISSPFATVMNQRKRRFGTREAPPPAPPPPPSLLLPQNGNMNTNGFVNDKNSSPMARKMAQRKRLFGTSNAPPPAAPPQFDQEYASSPMARAMVQRKRRFRNDLASPQSAPYNNAVLNTFVNGNTTGTSSPYATAMAQRKHRFGTEFAAAPPPPPLPAPLPNGEGMDAKLDFKLKDSIYYGNSSPMAQKMAQRKRLFGTNNAPPPAAPPQLDQECESSPYAGAMVQRKRRFRTDSAPPPPPPPTFLTGTNLNFNRSVSSPYATALAQRKHRFRTDLATPPPAPPLNITSNLETTIASSPYATAMAQRKHRFRTDLATPPPPPPAPPSSLIQGYCSPKRARKSTLSNPRFASSSDSVVEAAKKEKMKISIEKSNANNGTKPSPLSPGPKRSLSVDPRSPRVSLEKFNFN